MVLSEQGKWYVLHTFSTYETIVKETIEKLIENNDLADRILDIQIPMKREVEERKGKKKVVDKKMFPGYVFVKLVYDNELWYLLTNTRGVTGFVGPRGEAIPLTDDEVKRMQLENVATVIDFEVNDNIRVVAGPLEGYVGIIKEIDIHNQKAKVRISMFGRETPVEVEFIQIEKI